jgi:sugar phosphate isomerase/epimerase
MNDFIEIDRRQFALTATSLAAALGSPLYLLAKNAGTTNKARYKICAFTKFLNSMTFDEMADGIAEAGFDGIEVTARAKDSCIHPERAAEELPKLQEALQERDLAIMILTTDALSADQPHIEPMLRAAAKLGIPRYRLGFLRYDLDKPILPQLATYQPVFRDLAAMNREIGIAAVYQNHCGADNMGATIWDLHSLIKDYPVSEIGCVFDIRHATVEGGEAWPVYYNLMEPHLGAVSVKDFRWNGRKSAHTPLGKGQVDPRFFKMLKQSNFAGPISVHVEYESDAKINLAALKTDLATLRAWMDA